MRDSIGSDFYVLTPLVFIVSDLPCRSNVKLLTCDEPSSHFRLKRNLQRSYTRYLYAFNAPAGGCTRGDATGVTGRLAALGGG